MSGKVPELCDVSDILTMINPTYLSQLVLPEKGKVASTIDTLGINVMTYATNLINNQNPQVVSIKHLNADSPLKSLASLDILKRSELLERFDWNGKDVFGYSNKQAPDAVYECTLQPAVINGRSQKFLIFFESDQQSKDKERRKVAMKMWQATDVCRLHTTSELSVPAYTIRANLKWYHNSEYKNWQMSEDDIKKVYERTHRGGTPWKDLTADEKFEQKDKISKTQRRGHLEDILNAFLIDLCKSLVQVAYDMVQHTVNLYHKSNKKSTMFSAYFNESVKRKDAAVWDLHVFVGNMYFQRKLERVKFIETEGEHATWFGPSTLSDGEFKTLLDRENNTLRNGSKRLTEDIENFGPLVMRPTWSLKKKRIGDVQPLDYLCHGLFETNHILHADNVTLLTAIWKNWSCNVLWSEIRSGDGHSLNIVVLGVERVKFEVKKLFDSVETHKERIKKINDDIHNQEKELHGQSSQHIKHLMERNEQRIRSIQQEIKEIDEEIKRLPEIIDDMNSDDGESNMSDDEEYIQLKEDKKYCKARIDKINEKNHTLQKQYEEIEKRERIIKKLEDSKMKLINANHKITGMWYVTDITRLISQKEIYQDAIFNTLHLKWETIDHAKTGSNSLNDFEYSTLPKRHNFVSMTQREHFSQPWYKVITEPVMNVMENFFYDLIETLSWNSTKRSLDINMITLIDDVRRKRGRSPGIPLNRFHLHKQPDELEKDLSKMSLTRICLKSLSSTLPSKGKDMEELRAYLDKFHVPHAFTFFRMIRCPNIIALQEISRQCFSDPELKKRFDKYLSMMPLGMQTEILYILTDVRTGVSRKQSQPTASDSDSDSVEIVHSRSPSPDAGTGDDGDGSDGGGDDDDIHDDRGESPALQSDSDQPPSGDNVLRIENYPFKPRPSYQYVYDFFKTSKDLYVWFPDLINGKEHPSGLAPGWHKVAALTQPSEKHRRTKPNFYEMKFDVSEFRGADYGEKQLNHERYNSKSLPWSFSLPRSLYYPVNSQGNWTVIQNNVVIMNDKIKVIKGDGACLFRAIAYFQGSQYEAVEDDEFGEDIAQRAKFHNQTEKATELRELAIEQAWHHEEAFENQNHEHRETLIEYRTRMEQLDEYGTHFELTMLALYVLHQNFEVYVKVPSSDNNTYSRIHRIDTGDGQERHKLLFVNNNHYNVLIPRKSS